MKSENQPPVRARLPRFDFTLAGDANLDVLLYGLPQDLPVERELLADGMAMRLGGSGAITAHNLAALGNSVGFVSHLPEDEPGKFCRNELALAGVDLSRCVQRAGAQTGLTVLLQHQVHRRMLTYAGATFDLTASDLDLDYLARSRHFHMSSYYLQKALTPEIPKLFAELKARGLTISLDTNDDPSQTWDRDILNALRYVDVLLPNEREACLLAQANDLPEAIMILRRLVPLLIIKRGALGATAYTPSGCYSAAARQVEVIDAVGAGDSFNAGFLHGWVRGWPMQESLAFGNLAGAWSTTECGGTAAFRGKERMTAFFNEWSECFPVRC